jgi:anti-sigma B factor antagonist
MEVTINRQDDKTIVVFTGRLDTPSSQEVSNALEPVVADAKGTIILDCKDLDYISSSGLRIFLTVRKAAAAQGGTVIVKGMNSSIRSIFMMTGFLNLFQIEA